MRKGEKEKEENGKTDQSSLDIEFDEIVVRIGAAETDATKIFGIARECIQTGPEEDPVVEGEFECHIVPDIGAPDERTVGICLKTFEDTFLDEWYGKESDERKKYERNEKHLRSGECDRKEENESSDPGDACIGHEQEESTQCSVESECYYPATQKDSSFIEHIPECQYHQE